MSASDRVFAWTMATGESLVAFMVTWLLSVRVMGLFLGEAVAANAAMAVAVLAGIVIIIVEGLRRSAQLKRVTSSPSG